MVVEMRWGLLICLFGELAPYSFGWWKEAMAGGRECEVALLANFVDAKQAIG